MLKDYALVVLVCVSCVALPRPPDTPLCLYDNASKDDGSDKRPNFKCVSANGTRFTIPWNSPSATNLVGTPHDDYVRLQSYYKKIFDIMEKEFLNRAQGAR
jgi:hypothetical protein